MKITKLTLAVAVALSSLTLSANAQKGFLQDLDLQVAGGQGIPGVWAQVKPGAVGLTVGGLDVEARVFIAASPIQVLGELDPKSAIFLHENRTMHAGRDLDLTIDVPAWAADLPAFSLQAFAVDAQNRLHASSVTTVIVVDHSDPSTPVEGPFEPDPLGSGYEPDSEALSSAKQVEADGSADTSDRDKAALKKAAKKKAAMKAARSK